MQMQIRNIKVYPQAAGSVESIQAGGDSTPEYQRGIKLLVSDV